MKEKRRDNSGESTLLLKKQKTHVKYQEETSKNNLAKYQNVVNKEILVDTSIPYTYLILPISNTNGKKIIVVGEMFQVRIPSINSWFASLSQLYTTIMLMQNITNWSRVKDHESHCCWANCIFFFLLSFFNLHLTLGKADWSVPVLLKKFCTKTISYDLYPKVCLLSWI